MSRFAYVNGQFTPHAFATTHIEDRGYQFADGVYEVIAVIAGRLIDAVPHLQRLQYSVDELRINYQVNKVTLLQQIRELLRRNRLQEGMVYIQVTRGVAPRNHAFPAAVAPTLVMTCRYFDQHQFMKDKAKGVKAITLVDQRWRRPNIKSISLLANILGKQQAIDNGAYEAILLDDQGYVTESCATNVWIVNREGQLQTHPPSQKILNGITRQRLIELAAADNIVVKETPFTKAELLAASEIILSSSVAGIVAITAVDGHLINDGHPGPMTARLRDLYIEYTKTCPY